MKRCSCES